MKTTIKTSKELFDYLVKVYGMLHGTNNITDIDKENCSFVVNEGEDKI